VEKISEIMEAYGIRGTARTAEMRSYARELRSLRSLLAEMQPRYPSAIEAYAWIRRRIEVLHARLEAGHVPTVSPVVT